MPHGRVSFFVSFLGTTPCWSFQVPKLTQPVMDQASLLKKSTIYQLNNILYKVKKQTGTELAILILPNLEGQVLESVSLQVAEKWKLGSAEKDNGILLLISKEDRKIRIEVGEGMEGNLPDAYSKRVIDDVIAPYFKKGLFDEGVMAGTFQILRYAHPDKDWQSFFKGNTKFNSQVFSKRSGKRSGVKSKPSLFDLSIKALIFFLIIFLSIVSPPFRNLLFLLVLTRASGFGGRGGFGGDGGGGSFGGGGGGFSGGGASGGW